MPLSIFQFMKRILTFILLLIPVLLFCQEKPATPPIVVELFTSEGCSSCPPADALLGELETQGRFHAHPIIVLSEHVDYWNGLGWKDRFSSAEFTNRQAEYARRFGLDTVYTPQIIINGRTQIVGNDPVAVQKALGVFDNPSAEVVNIFLSPDNLAHISIAGARSGTRAFLAITETSLTTSVHAGENRNRELHHAGVVRQLRDLGPINGTFSVNLPLWIDPMWKRQNVHVVVFTQHGAAGPIEGAASVPLP